MPTAQEELIGKHPSAPNFIAAWLSGEDLKASPNKKHRKLAELAGGRAAATEELANLLVQHHINEEKILDIQKRRNEILKKYKLNTLQPYIEAQGFFPVNPKTKSGNLTEILLSHYLQSTSGLVLLAYKLTYNGNVDQALKGDDCLLFDRDNLSSKVITGEAKFRSKPTGKVIRDIIKNLEGSKKLPISLPFLAQHFTTKGDHIMSAKISDLQFELKSGTVPLVNVGLLLSTKSASLSYDTVQQIDKNFNTTNPNLVIISLGVDDPGTIIDQAFTIANEKLARIK